MDESLQIVFVVEASPPKTGLYKDLQPRFQMWNDDTICVYHTQQEADSYAAACRTDRNGWHYVSKPITLSKEHLEDPTKYRFSS